MKYEYIHWFVIDFINETPTGIEWKNLKEYKEKYDCSIEVYYYENTMAKKAIKLECNQSYQDLDLDVNSLFDGSLLRVQRKPKYIKPYNKPIEFFFERYIKENNDLNIDEDCEEEGI